jgi:radical SAM protein with 4Fe4S-binding SPASM domain
LRVSFCVTSLNEHERDAFIDQWTPVVDFFSIQQYGNTFEGEYARDRSRLFSPKNPYHPEPGLRCAQPNKRAMVRHNGDVIPCCDASGLHLVIGNIHQASLKEIWQGARARELRSLHRQGRWADDPICRACQAKWRPDENIGEPRGRS